MPCCLVLVRATEFGSNLGSKLFVVRSLSWPAGGLTHPDENDAPRATATRPLTRSQPTRPRRCGIAPAPRRFGPLSLALAGRCQGRSPQTQLVKEKKPDGSPFAGTEAYAGDAQRRRLPVRSGSQEKPGHRKRAGR
jgi:hypothetical protein